MDAEEWVGVVVQIDSRTAQDVETLFLDEYSFFIVGFVAFY
jgi:hypothetical protein